MHLDYIDFGGFERYSDLECTWAGRTGGSGLYEEGRGRYPQEVGACSEKAFVAQIIYRFKCKIIWYTSYLLILEVWRGISIMETPHLVEQGVWRTRRRRKRGVGTLTRWALIQRKPLQPR